MIIILYRGSLEHHMTLLNKGNHIEKEGISLKKEMDPFNYEA